MSVGKVVYYFWSDYEYDVEVPYRDMDFAQKWPFGWCQKLFEIKKGKCLSTVYSYKHVLKCGKSQTSYSIHEMTWCNIIFYYVGLLKRYVLIKQ